MTRSRSDLCPGVQRPWPAEDGGLVRIRLVGGAVSGPGLAALAAVAAAYGDGELHLTGRANLQLRGLPLEDGVLPVKVSEAITATGLVPHPTHDLVRNVMLSPLSGISGGTADLRAVARSYDDLLCADPGLAELPGRFLVVLDDGRGDVQGRSLDLGAMAVDAGHAQVRAGSSGWGEVLDLEEVPAALVALAHTFLDARGSGETAAWHVDELDAPLLDGARDVRTLRNAGPLPYGLHEGAEHVEVPDGVLTPALLEQLTGAAELVVTPWNGIVVPVGTVTA
ncbi:MAG: nitrite reductase [Marmoricola sp.]